MTKLQDVKAAIKKLPEEDRTALLDWLARANRRAWDKQIRRLLRRRARQEVA